MNAHDNWQPSATIDTLKKRAQILSDIRSFFTSRSYLEVETPIMAQYGVTDVYLSNIQAHFRGKPYNLQTSPEYHMKRLLAAGSGPIFQLARVFRDDELGRWHNPEFTMLEWYQLDVDHHGLMDEMDEFLQQFLSCKPMLRVTYQEVFNDLFGFDPLHTNTQELNLILKRYQLDQVLPADETDCDQHLFLLMSHVVEPALAKKEAPVAVYGFPPSQAALAQINQGVAERFEIYYQGVELANGFHELTNSDEQIVRFNQDRVERSAKGFAMREMDGYFLQALKHGLPPCSGVALGVDRLIALMLHSSSLADIMSFAFNRA